MINPTLIKGNSHQDQRGILCFNNDFDASQVKRIYTIENADIAVIRAWQGHQIEQRWFVPTQGSFLIKLIKIDDWQMPSKNLHQFEFDLSANSFDVLHIPPGFVSFIQAKEDKSKLLVLADYALNEVQDEFRFDKDYFNKF